MKHSSINDKSNPYGSYYTCFKSKLTVAKTSTLLREVFVCNNKIFSCNLTGSDLFNYPMEGINSLNNCNQSDFNKRIDKILGLSEIQYFAEFKIRTPCAPRRSEVLAMIKERLLEVVLSNSFHLRINH